MSGLYMSSSIYKLTDASDVVYRFFSVSMLINGIKICCYCILVYNGVYSPLICDFVKQLKQL